MSQFPQMIYKAGGTEEIHGDRFSTHIVHDASELDAALAGGWSLTTTEARDAGNTESSPDSAPPTRDELKQKATELGLIFAGNISTEKLAGLVDAALAEQAKG